MTIAIDRIDHLAITAEDLSTTVDFYRRTADAVILHEHRIDGRIMVVQLGLGGAMLNIHQAGHGHPLVAARPTPGSADLCFGWSAPIETAVAHLSERGIAIIEGPVARLSSTGADGLSVYFRDPDGNLIEFLSTSDSPAS